MTKRAENSVTQKRKCNVSGCDVAGADNLTLGLCTDGHWWTHRGLADPEPAAKPTPAPEPAEPGPVLNSVGGTPIPEDEPAKKDEPAPTKKKA